MIITKIFTLSFIAGLIKPVVTNRLNPETEIKKNTTSKANSLAYLAYKSKKQKGLIPVESTDCPTIYFGDEWAL